MTQDQMDRMVSALRALSEDEYAGCRRDEEEFFYCVYCDASERPYPHELKHSPDCPIAKARALLIEVDGGLTP